MAVKPFVKFKQPCTVRKELLRLVEAAPECDWTQDRPKLPWKLAIPFDLISQDVVIGAISSFYKATTRVWAFRMPPYTTYDWHQDIDARSCGINLQLNAFDQSWMMFGSPIEGENAHNGLSCLEYSMDAYYLVDLQRPHMVANLSGDTRYMVTMGMSVPYEKMLGNLRNHLEAPWD